MNMGGTQIGSIAFRKTPNEKFGEILPLFSAVAIKCDDRVWIDFANAIASDFMSFVDTHKKRSETVKEQATVLCPTGNKSLPLTVSQADMLAYELAP
jgi:hypothetical protein